jgi:hypothetical protein
VIRGRGNRSTRVITASTSPVVPDGPAPGGSPFFGERWDAPAVEDAVQVPTPVGEVCQYCGEPIAAGDRGWVRAPQVWAHTECEMLGIVGHLYGVCSCSGFDESRAAALVLLGRINAARATQGMRPL